MKAISKKVYYWQVWIIFSCSYCQNVTALETPESAAVGLHERRPAHTFPCTPTFKQEKAGHGESNVTFEDFYVLVVLCQVFVFSHNIFPT